MTRSGTWAIAPGSGEDVGQRARELMITPIEAFVDAAVVSWHPQHAAAVASIRSTFAREAESELTTQVATLLAEHPDARDQLAPAPWRDALRMVGFLGGATALAAFLAGLGVRRWGGQAPELSTTVVVAAVGALVALVCLGSSLLRPRWMGVPNRFVSMSLWIATVGALGSVVVLPLWQESWSTTPRWLLVCAAAGAGLLVLAVIVSWTRRRARTRGRPGDDTLRDLRVSILTGALGRAREAVEAAWASLDPSDRTQIERERTYALTAVEQRVPDQLDSSWMRAVAPGVRGLAHHADKTLELMHSGDAMSLKRSVKGKHGYFVTLARREAQ